MSKIIKSGKTAKGIKKYLIKKSIKHSDDKNTFPNNNKMFHIMSTIRSVKHQIGSYKLNRISLSCFDDKRWIHNDGINSYAYGHYKI